jgi:hypothetical protein
MNPMQRARSDARGIQERTVNLKKLFGLAAIAGLMFVAAPTQQANAVSLNNPGVAATVQGAGEGLKTDVQYRRHHHHRGYRHHHVRRHHHWHRHHHVRRHHGWHRPHFRHHGHRHWR